MVYVLIALGLAVVIAPLISAMPSKAQRRVAAVRDRAKDLGLRVSLRPVPAVPARFRFEPERDLACYQQVQSRAKSELSEQRAYVFSDGHWQPTQGASIAPAWLTILPLGASLVEVSDRYLSIFWDEREGLEGLEMIRQAIDSRQTNDAGF
jgi:hypothetical protein